jgi:hypothetical protein
MFLISLWLVFIILMSISVLGRRIDTFHYLLYALVLLYITIIYNEIK